MADLTQAAMGPLLAVAVFLVGLGVILAEKKFRKRARRKANVQARREQEHHADAGRTALGIETVEDVVRNALRREADEKTLRRGVCPSDVHDVFPEEDGR